MHKMERGPVQEGLANTLTSNERIEDSGIEQGEQGALAIATRLGEERQAGADVKCRCPLCGGRLALRDGERGLLAKCWAGCEAVDVYTELRRLGHFTDDPPPP